MNAEKLKNQVYFAASRAGQLYNQTKDATKTNINVSEYLTKKTENVNTGVPGMYFKRNIKFQYPVQHYGCSVAMKRQKDIFAKLFEKNVCLFDDANGYSSEIEFYIIQQAFGQRTFLSHVDAG